MTYSARNYRTEFGTVTISADAVSIEADGTQLWSWANRPGCSWPCSTLARLDSIKVGFDSNGLLDLTSTDEGGVVDSENDELTSDELSAWSSDVLDGIVPENHPTYPVTVGQFKERS